MSNIEILKMTEKDYNQISKNLVVDFDNFWNKNILKSELENKFSTYIVAKDEKNILGFAGMIDTLEQMEITNIVVKKSERNKGVGQKLLTNLIKIAKEYKKEKIILEVNENNSIAIKMYLKNGFKKIGLRKNYYNSENAIIMSLKIY